MIEENSVLSTSSFVLFRLDAVRYAIALDSVERVTRSVMLTPLPSGSDRVCGVINMHGAILPVINTRRVLGFPPKEIDLDDVYIVARTSKRTVVLIADSVDKVAEIAEERIASPMGIVPEVDLLAGLTPLDNDIVLIQDLERCLSQDDLSHIETGITELTA